MALAQHYAGCAQKRDGNGNLRTQQAVPDVVNWREQASLTLWIHYNISNEVGRVKVLGVVFS